MGLYLRLNTLTGIERPIPSFPGDRLPTSMASSSKSSNLFDKLHQQDLAEFASHCTNLNPTGPGRWKGLCPIHQEKTPSFYIYSEPWYWHCFGACAQGGDIVDLARELKLVGRR